MEILYTKNLTFTYPNENSPAIKDINLSINKGDFILLFGKSGSGKSTLLKNLKQNIIPFGKKEGRVFFYNEDISNLDKKEEAEKIAYVSQNAENQIVTDKVWHELAFTLENLGIAQDEIRKRVAEIASFFDITSWFDRETSTLSGGEKQKLNLAAAIVTKPELLMLDEPTANLDPIAREAFIYLLSKINDELGITIVLTEHSLDGILEKTTKILAIENGETIFTGTASDFVKFIYSSNDYKNYLPVQTEIAKSLQDKNDVFTIKDAQKLFESLNLPKTILNRAFKENHEVILSLKNIYFKYKKEYPDILKDLNFEIKKNDYISIIGSNGAGKTTLTKLITGAKKAYRGQVQKAKNLKISMLSQDSSSLFIKNSIKEDFEDVSDDYNHYAKLFEVECYLDKHPFDVSHGVLQICAIIKVLLTDPDVLILDEPTNGIDMTYKIKIAKILKDLNDKGKTIIIISHDIQFCAENTKKTYLLFNGDIIASGETKTFLASNFFYTTAASQIAGNTIKNVVSSQEVIDYAKNTKK